MGERDRRMGERDRRVLRLGGKRAGWRQPEGEREGMSVMNAWGFLHWSIISLCFSGYIYIYIYFFLDRLALCLVYALCLVAISFIFPWDACLI